METAVKFNADEFRSYLYQTENKFSLDLSHASVLDIVEEHIKIKEPLHPTYCNGRLTLIKHLRLLENEVGITLMPSHVTDIFYINFVAFMQNKGLVLTTIKSTVNNLRTDLAWAAKYKAALTDTYDCIDIPKFHREQFALSPDEVSWIYHFDIGTLNVRPQHKRCLEQVKDMFVLSCNLGQRHSDMIRIGRENFKNGKFSIIQQKTKNKAVVDISKCAISPRVTYEILEKYNYEAPYKANISNYNHQLHELFKLMGWTSEEHQTIVSGNLNYERKIPRYKLFGSHTARRTFATVNYVLRKYPALDVMKCTGHSSEASFHSYICNTSDTDD